MKITSIISVMVIIVVILLPQPSTAGEEGSVITPPTLSASPVSSGYVRVGVSQSIIVGPSLMYYGGVVAHYVSSASKNEVTFKLSLSDATGQGREYLYNSEMARINVEGHSFEVHEVCDEYIILKYMGYDSDMASGRPFNVHVE